MRVADPRINHPGQTEVRKPEKTRSNRHIVIKNRVVQKKWEGMDLGPPINRPQAPSTSSVTSGITHDPEINSQWLAGAGGQEGRGVGARGSCRGYGRGGAARLWCINPDPPTKRGGALSWPRDRAAIRADRPWPWKLKARWVVFIAGPVYAPPALPRQRKRCCSASARPPRGGHRASWA